MKFTEKYSRLFQLLLPSPLSIALLLSLVTIAAAYIFTTSSNSVDQNYLITLLEFWERGLWNNSLMVFALQMMLMLVLGHILAMSPLVSKFIDKISIFATNNARAALLVCFSTIAVALFNWGLGLIFGAIIARKIGEKAQREGFVLNYPLIGAAGYSCLMVWHGGISGSSTTKVAEKGHLTSLMEGILPPEKLTELPTAIPFSETVFSSMNVFASVAVLILIPLLMYLIGKNSSGTDLNRLKSTENRLEQRKNLIGAEKIDYSNLTTKIVGSIILFYLGYKVLHTTDVFKFSFVTPNFINLSLLGLGFFFHKNIIGFLRAAEQAIGGASGILIQFPLYFGIMGIMKESGLVNMLSNFFVAHATIESFPIFTLFSAGIVNVFVPSGGGQWAIQGPIIIQAADSLQTSLPKRIMALAYGDQLTNMLQPFWALPLLGITKLKAKEILPYTLVMMLAGAAIYISALLLF